MGMVYEGFDPGIERRVAIKTILADFLDEADMDDAIARFKREAQAAGRLHHPGIVSVYELGEDAGMAYIAMEYVEGNELKKLLADNSKLQIIDIFEIMKQILAALEYSHKQGVIHRDIKPANIMVMSGPKVKIMDFGIARLESSNLTQAGTVVGTPTHMSPEQLMGLTADGRADLWACGVILYEMLTGNSPFNAETPAVVMHHVLQREPPPPSTVNAGVPVGFDAVCARALAKKADARFQSAREFQVALVQALKGRTSGDRTSSVMIEPVARTVQKKGLSFRPEALAEIEKALSSYIGPLGKLLVARTQAEATTLDEFFRLLVENIPEEDERAEFLKKMNAFKKPAGATSITPPAAASRVAPAAEVAKTQISAPAAAPAFSPEMLATAERRLASYVGPLARLLIKDAVGTSMSAKDLYAQLAAHIDSEDERKEFLASLPRQG